ncbi:Uncharacterized protein dnm_096820 [Desulfonema magnum]|uniref:Uncharacterized protein n=1 Tax=Desulfonema magnum TaxID=45655 RepID=A0A975BZ70_9BACT|nr:Uncharacterized protein dnm_096820 [Desulfonema magnum]
MKVKKASQEYKKTRVGKTRVLSCAFLFCGKLDQGNDMDLMKKKKKRLYIF